MPSQDHVTGVHRCSVGAAHRLHSQLVAVKKGEHIQKLGDIGVRQAKRWLDSTLMAEVHWISGEPGDGKITFERADGEELFTFDMGGLLTGLAHKSKVFVGECKNYQDAGDQGALYRRFLAQCYRAEDSSTFVDAYLWITSAPFLSTQWSKKEGVDFIKESIELKERHKEIALGSSTFDEEIAQAVSDKLITVVISKRQLKMLSLDGEELLKVQKAILGARG